MPGLCETVKTGSHMPGLCETVKTTVRTTVVFTVYLIVSIGILMELEPDWSGIDAAYFTMATLATVGYGDLAPTSDASRVVTVFMIFFGISIVLSQVAGLISLATAPITNKGRKLLAKAFPPKGVDLDLSGDIDFYQPRHPIVFYTWNLLPSIALNVVVQCISAAIFVAIDPTWSFGRWLYHCFVTATTVGYGDTLNGTQEGRLWSCFHILISVAMLGEVVSSIDELRSERKATLERNRMFTTRLSTQRLDDLLEHAIALRNVYQEHNLQKAARAHSVPFGVLASLLGQIKSSMAQSIYRSMDLFRRIDMDGDGVVNASEWRAAVRSLGVVAPASTVDAIFAALDIDGSGELNYTELHQEVESGLGMTESEFALAMMLELGIIQAEHVTPFIKQFRMIDVDGNTRLSRSDLVAAEGKSLAQIQAAAAQRRKRRSVRTDPKGATCAVRSTATGQGHSKPMELNSERLIPPWWKGPTASTADTADTAAGAAPISSVSFSFVTGDVPLAAVDDSPMTLRLSHAAPSMADLWTLYGHQRLMIYELQQQIDQLQQSTTPPPEWRGPLRFPALATPCSSARIAPILVEGTTYTQRITRSSERAYATK